MSLFILYLIWSQNLEFLNTKKCEREELTTDCIMALTHQEYLLERTEDGGKSLI